MSDRLSATATARGRPILVESVPNFSEGRRFDVISKIAAAAGARLLDSDPDPDHNRFVLSIGGAADRVRDCVYDAIAVAVETIDLRAHTGVHPRVGAADVVPFVPLTSAAGLTPAIELAHQLGERVWAELRVPVLFYGAAAPDGKRALQEIRGPSPPAPDIGSGRHPTAGWVCIGARWPLVAYNVLLPGVPVTTASLIARSIRMSSGGLPGVQALGFAVTLGSQVSTNLTALELTSPQAVLAAVQVLCRSLDVRPGADQVVGLCPAAHALPAASGALLEGRLGAAGARLGALAARAGDPSQLGLATQLEAGADRLATLPYVGQHLLAGAEEMAAIKHLLVAHHIADPEAIALLEHAARELARVAQQSAEA